jgi:hypothetical protein
MFADFRVTPDDVAEPCAIAKDGQTAQRIGQGSVGHYARHTFAADFCKGGAKWRSRDVASGHRSSVPAAREIA